MPADQPVALASASRGGDAGRYASDRTDVLRLRSLCPWVVPISGLAARSSRVVTGGGHDECLRRAQVALSFLAKPGDPELGAALRTRAASELLALATGTDADG